mgnify:CR=1 FL=1
MRSNKLNVRGGFSNDYRGDRNRGESGEEGSWSLYLAGMRGLRERTLGAAISVGCSQYPLSEMQHKIDLEISDSWAQFPQRSGASCLEGW